ncbi:binding [Pyrenophora seminiperda CCB06]|uniref:Binding n=1 Tax=Pyrenophora seminiperda CCB06 TaxID=1302712 RepID=A0A3M7MC48_9PLEO|nr:binding [Pyrenophora seminiperda CCB06]
MTLKKGLGRCNVPASSVPFLVPKPIVTKHVASLVLKARLWHGTCAWAGAALCIYAMTGASYYQIGLNSTATPHLTIIYKGADKTVPISPILINSNTFNTLNLPRYPPLTNKHSLFAKTPKQQTIKMQYTIAFTTFVAGAMAATACSSAPAATGTAPAPVDNNGYFGVVSARSASPIHLQTLTARNGKFYLGGAGPTSYCPPNIGASNCPAGNTTVLSGGATTLNMGVVVPGGQQVFVQADGVMGYTQAHSAALPAGATQTGFSRDAPTGSNEFGYLHFDTGFVACPAGEGQGYQVFGQTADAKFGPECLGFNALTVATAQPGAWQY